MSADTTALIPNTITGRRYLTILFCDLVGFLDLSSQRDPEDVQFVQRQYQDAGRKAVEAYGGFVASFSGDGILAYFGYPLAHENDAERAILAALDIINRVSRLDIVVRQQRIPRLAVRIGLHTGLVALGTEIASSGPAQHSVSGEVVSIASRIQSEAATNAVVISNDTFELIYGLFDTEALGQRQIKGLPYPLFLHKVVRARQDGDRFRGRSRRGASRMIGRSVELEGFAQYWRRARDRQRCLTVFITGEAGVGKTRFVMELCRHPDFADGRILRIHCDEIFATTPLHPFVNFICMQAGLTADDATDTKREKISALLRGLAILSADDLDSVAALIDLATENKTVSAPVTLLSKNKQLDLLASIVRKIIAQRPTMLWVEDAHWLDPSSSELLRLIIANLAAAPTLVVVTLRSFPAPPDLPKADATIALEQLRAEECLDLARSIPGSRALPDEVLLQAAQVADGVPLFAEQLVLSLIDEGPPGTGSLRRRGLPLSLAEHISERLDRIRGARRVIQAAACIGRSFTPEFLASVLNEDEKAVSEPLEALVTAEILKPRRDEPQAVYEFRHALLQRLAHESIAKDERKRIHARIVDLTKQGAHRKPALPEVLAYHLTEAEDFREAIQRWLEAGVSASRRSAHVEAIDHLRRGIALLGELSDTRALELSLQAALIGPLSAVNGATSLEFSGCCLRGLELCKEGPPTPLIFPFLFGLFTFSMCRGHLLQASHLADRFLSLANQASYDSGRVIGYRLSGMALLGQGRAADAKKQLEESLMLYSPERDSATIQMFGQNTEVHSRSLLSLAHFCLGEVDEALKVGLDALRNADSLRHPHSTAIALGYVGGWVFGWLGATEAMMREAHRLIVLSEQHRLGPFRSFGVAFLGWALCQNGEVKPGTALLEQALKEFEAADFRMSIPGHLAVLADVMRHAGKYDEAAALCRRARLWISEGTDLWLEPEVRRVEALVTHAINSNDGELAEDSLRGAVRCARDLSFPIFELRCLLSLRSLLGPKRHDDEIECRISALGAFKDLKQYAARARQAREYVVGF